MNPQPDSQSSELKALLAEIVSKTDAIGSMAWDCSSLPYKELGFHYSNEEQPIQLGCSPTDHLNLLEAVVTDQQPKIALPSQDDSGGKAPVLAMVPLKGIDSDSWVIETFLQPNQLPEKYREWLGKIIEVLSGGPSSDPIDGDLAKSQLPEAPETQELGTQGLVAKDLGGYCEQIHQTILSRETSSTIANETRRLVECDRVSVVKFNGNLYKIVAISGQQSVNRRSNTVRLLESLAKIVLPLREDFVYPSSNEESAPQVEKALEDYLKLSVSRSVIILPLFEKPTEEIADAAERPKEPKLIGGLIVENFTENWVVDQNLPTLRQASIHAANAYANSLQHENLWLYPLWNLLGKSKFLTATRRLPITLSIAIGVLILTLSLIIIPWEFKVVCDGELVPQDIQYIYAPIDGKVLEVVPGGSSIPLHDEFIDPDDPFVIARLISHDLQARVSEIQGQLDEVDSRIRQQFENIDKQDEKQSALQNEGELRAKRDSLLIQLNELKKKSEQLQVKSKLAGTVLTHSTEDQLIGRPFKRGDKLLEVADTDGPWIVELRMPDNRIGHVLNAQNEIRDDLTVTCVLSTDASQSFTGKILEVAQSTEVSQEGQTVLIKVAIDADSRPTFLRARAQVVGKVHCGRRSLGYVWFHQVGEFLQKNVWFRIW